VAKLDVNKLDCLGIGRAVRMKLTVISERISLTLFLTFDLVVMHDYCENPTQTTSDVCDPSSVDVVRSSALALVPYDEQTLVVPDFYRDEHRLRFGDFTVTVSQNWRDVGVAAVVWDAVSFVDFNFIAFLLKPLHKLWLGEGVSPFPAAWSKMSPFVLNLNLKVNCKVLVMVIMVHCRTENSILQLCKNIILVP